MYYNSAAVVFLTHSIPRPQIEHIWVFPLLYGSVQHELTQRTKKYRWNASSALYIYVGIPLVYMSSMASDRRLDRFGTSERCIICELFLCYMMYYTLKSVFYSQDCHCLYVGQSSILSP